MTREEAIHTLNLLFVPCASDGNKWGCKRNEAIDMAIEALQREDNLLKSLETNEPIYDMVDVVRCKDCVYRKEIGDDANGYHCGCYVMEHNDASWFCCFGHRKGGEDE